MLTKNIFNIPRHPFMMVGWNEWCALPELHIPAIKAKIDTGAKTSALHAFNIHPFAHHGKHFVRFDLHPLQSNDKVVVTCRAAVIDQRYVMSSNGHKEHRYVISTTLRLGSSAWKIELTLSNRDPLKFRMLLGREALNHRVIIDSSHVLLHGKISHEMLEELYR